MADLSINTPNISAQQPGSSSAGLFGGASVQSSGIFSTEKKKIVLTQEDIGAMSKCSPPLDPNKEEDVQKWVRLPEEQKNVFRTSYIESLNNVTSMDSPEIKDSQDQEKVQSQNPTINLPENWSEMSTKAKSSFIFNLLGEMQCGEEWATMPENDKKVAIYRQLELLTSQKVGQFEKMNETDRNNEIEKTYLQLAAVLKDFDGKSLGNGELKVAMDSFIALDRKSQSQKIAQVHKELDTAIHHHGEVNSHEHANADKHTHHGGTNRVEFELRQQVAKELNIKLGDVSEQDTYEYLKKVVGQDGKLPDEYRDLQEYYNALKIEANISSDGKIHRNNGTPTISLSDILGEKLITDPRGNIDRNKDTNIELINNYVRGFKSYDEFIEFLNDLSGNERNLVLRSIQNKEHGFSKEELDRLGLHKLGIEFTAVAHTHEASEAAQMTSTDAYYSNREQYNSANFHKLSAKNNTTAAQEYLGQKSVESNDTNDVAYFNQYTSQREDWQNIYTNLNSYVANSETVSDEMRQFYAQNSIESLQTPEQRNWQSEDLRSYKNDYLSKGLEIGLSNLANGETPTVPESSAEYIQKSSNIQLQQSNQMKVLSESAQQVYSTIDEMLNGNLQESELVAKFTELPRQEQTQLLKLYVADKGDKVNVQLCNTFPELVPLLVNNGKGLEIVAKCSMPVGNQAIKIMPDKDKKLLAIQNPHRLSQGTYQALVDNGVIKVGDSNSSYSAKA